MSYFCVHLVLHMYDPAACAAHFHSLPRLMSSISSFHAVNFLILCKANAMAVSSPVPLFFLPAYLRLLALLEVSIA